MAEYQKKLNFTLKELVPFRADQLVSEIKSASLEPNVICHEHGQYVILRGKLVFCGEYYPQNYEIQEDFFAEQNVADVFRNNENGYCTFNYAFPVDITIPQDRILSTDEISIGIDHFDCAVEEDGFVSVSAELFVDGVYEREYVEHVRYQNQVHEQVNSEIPALHVVDELDESTHLESQFETPQAFTDHQEFTTENSDNHHAEFRNHQGDAWDKTQYDHHSSNLNEFYNPQNMNSEYNEAVPNNKESYDEQIKYHTTYDYDPWNHNFNNTNSYSQADYYRNPYDATYQGGAETQYYNQPNEKMDSIDSSISNTSDEYIDQYVMFTPIQKPAFEETESSDYDIKFIPEDAVDTRTEGIQVDYEPPTFNVFADNPIEASNQNDPRESHLEFSNESNTANSISDSPEESPADSIADSPEESPVGSPKVHFEKKSPIIQNEVVLDVEKPTTSRTDGYDKVVFPFADDENTFGKNDEYEFCDETDVHPKAKPVQENAKAAAKEMGTSRVVSDFFNVRGKEEKSSCLKIYIVQRGDSLEQLAEKYATNASKIASFNQLELNDKILEGQVIYIPE